jgi:alkylation response protein AidB-like acyl-CoA dehydrogenase
MLLVSPKAGRYRLTEELGNRQRSDRLRGEKMSADKQQEYDQFRDMVRRLTVSKITPHAAEVDRTSSIPRAGYAAIHDAGLIGLVVPEEAGGQGGDLMSQVIVMEEISRGCATSALSLMSTWSHLDTMHQHGAPEHFKQVFADLSSGKTVGAWCYTEPSGGSDLAGLKTNAQKVPGGWVLNGRKRFITNATWADWYLVLARTGKDTTGVFLVNRSDPGVSFGKLESKMGFRGSPTADVVLDDCRLAEPRQVGDPTAGWDIAMSSLLDSRCWVSAQALGIAQGALDAAVQYTSERHAFGQAVAKFQLVRAMVADMTIKIEASRALLYSVVGMVHSNPVKARAFTAMAKVQCTDTANAVTTDAVQLHGGYGYLQDFPVERMMRDAKITQIWEGTNQIQRMLVAKHVYGSSSRSA